LVFRLYFGQMICLETLVILDKFYNYVNIDNDDIFLQDISLLIKKYRPFTQISDRIRIAGEMHYK